MGLFCRHDWEETKVPETTPWTNFDRCTKCGKVRKWWCFAPPKGEIDAYIKKVVKGIKER